MQEIVSGIYIDSSYTGVTLGALILSHGTILIDAPLRPEDARSWRAALINVGSSGNRLLVNLDAHPDRTLGARAMEATIVAHNKTAQVFRTRPSVFKGGNAESGSEWESYSEAVGMRWAIPDITFTQRLNLHWGPPDVILEYHPGPSAGAIWAIIPDAKVIFVGDAVLHNQPPFLTNADVSGWLESLEVLLASYEDYRVVSGRSGLVPFEAVKVHHKTLKNIIKGMEKLAKRNAVPENTENMVKGILSEYSFPAHLEEQYAQRLRHGLNQYYSRRYRSLDSGKSSENES